MTLGNVDGGSLDDYAHLDSDGVTTNDEINNDNNDNNGDDGDDTANE